VRYPVKRGKVKQWHIKLEKARSWFSKVVNAFEVTMLIAGTSALAILLNVNIVARQFFRAIYFIDELTQISIIWTTFGGLSYAVRKVRHIRMGAIFDIMPHSTKKILILLICAVSAAVMLSMSCLGVFYLIKVAKLEQTTPALRIPYWLFISITPVGFLAAGVRYILTFIKNIIDREVWLSSEQKGEYEDIQE